MRILCTSLGYFKKYLIFARMKRYFCLAALALSFSSRAQEVISGNTQNIAGGGYSFDLTLGEPASQTLSGGGYAVTQGFNQPYLFTTLVEAGDKNITFSIYPNPTSQYIRVNGPAHSTVKITLVNEQGVEVLKENTSANSTISLEGIPAGVYFLKLQDQNTNKFNSYKISKVNP